MNGNRNRKILLFYNFHAKFLASKRAIVLIAISDFFNSNGVIITHHRHPFGALIPFNSGNVGSVFTCCPINVWK